MRPVPVITPSAGNSGFWLSANIPSSNSIFPSSSRSFKRSRAKSFFCLRLRAWYFSAPPLLMRSICAANCSSLLVMKPGIPFSVELVELLYNMGTPVYKGLLSLSTTHQGHSNNSERKDDDQPGQNTCDEHERGTPCVGRCCCWRA